MELETDLAIAPANVAPADALPAALAVVTAPPTLPRLIYTSVNLLINTTVRSKILMFLRRPELRAKNTTVANRNCPLTIYSLGRRHSEILKSN